ncbi:hypothetical protein H1P_110063 [Hyella patelloides LEGE 07179]|uniref:Uncharacterized protein n=1 Tax=Hyella patelloides LEGE 07179 TaxID=945734 RepID=A0A563VJR7_9CYAN|nr:hypothetical protein H1P_110063 [Hyella patelloides LEGE 07179]
MTDHNRLYRVFVFLLILNSCVTVFFAWVLVFSSLNSDTFAIILALLVVANLIGAGLMSIYSLLKSIMNELKKKIN